MNGGECCVCHESFGQWPVRLVVVEKNVHGQCSPLFAHDFHFDGPDAHRVEPLPAPLAPVKRDEPECRPLIVDLYRIAFTACAIVGAVVVIVLVFRSCGGAS